MQRLVFFLSTIMMLFPLSAHAINCFQDAAGGNTSITFTVPTFAIPSNAKVGEKIWQGNDINITVFCNNAKTGTNVTGKENIFAWVNLTDPSVNDASIVNNPYLKFGIHYNGVDYDAVDFGIDTGVCIDMQANGGVWKANCNGSKIVKNVSFNARFYPYIKFKSMPSGSIIQNLPPVAVVQFDGSGGANLLKGAKNLRVNIDGLNNIHTVDCSVIMSMEPANQIVNFGQFRAENNMRLTSPFSLTASTDPQALCTQRFSVYSSFYTDEALDSETQMNLQNGLSLRIIDEQTSSPVKMNTFTLFGDFNPKGVQSRVVRNYMAELTRNAAPLVLGPFQRDVILLINYQ